MRSDINESSVRFDFSLLSEQDLYLFNEGTHYRVQEKLGAHLAEAGGTKGAYFAAWAPDAIRVSVIGDFNGWNHASHSLRPRGSSGIWEGFVPGIGQGSLYKFHIQSRYEGRETQKADPFAFRAEVPPRTASIVWNLDYDWGDSAWMSSRRGRNSLDAPMSIYEVHLGSWKPPKSPEQRFPGYRELAPLLADYVQEHGFTHVEFMPVMEHPFYGSWGYQLTGYYAPSSRYGTPQDLMYLIDVLHQRGIGVILDWVPSHFPTDPHGLGNFDGTHLFEHQDPREGFHPDWNSYIFNYGRHEVCSFLISNALFWLRTYHADGLRVDAVASMLYRDYSRKAGEWIPNVYGGRENLEAVSLLRRLNEEVYKELPDVQMIAEESTAWQMVSRPTYVGGLGFGFKWDMGWMHDTLKYMKKDPVYRRYHLGELTFRMIYAFHENFILPLSHDEVTHGKSSLLHQMAGDDWQKFANLRLLFGYMFGMPGKKLLFMGGEFGQRKEWDHESFLEWDLLQYAPHSGLKTLVRDLNHMYRAEPALHVTDAEPSGFEWIDCTDSASSVVTFLRRSGKDMVVVACNFTPVPRGDYRIGVPHGAFWKELVNTDAGIYGGSGQGNLGGVGADPVPWNGRPFSVKVIVPPLAAIFLKSSK